MTGRYGSSYGNYYDPVGSQANQPSGYTYSGQQQSSNAAQYGSNTASNFGTNYSNQAYGDTYGSQQYGSSATQQPVSASTNRSTNAINSLSGSHNYGQTTSAQSSSNTATGYESTYYSDPNSFAQTSARSQANASPLYNTAGSTFGRLSLPDQSQGSSTTFGNTRSHQATASQPTTEYQNAPSSAGLKNRSYRATYNQTQEQAQAQQPQRYASTFHAVQAQQGHQEQPSRSSNHQPSPQMSAQQPQNQHQRQPSASVEPASFTVDPSQVYDARAEQQRQAAKELEKRRQREAAKAEEERVAAEAAEKERLDHEKREAEEIAKKAAEAEAKRKEVQQRKNEQRRKQREEKRQSKTAATALTQMASGAAGDGGMIAMMGIDESQPPANDEEAEMRAMFKKMREFNAKNPQMLAKLWEEERKAHAQQASAPQPPKAAQAAPPLQQQRANSTAVRTPVPPTSKPAAQVPPATAPSAQTASTALWAPQKKGSIAEAASKWLNNLHENRNVGRIIAKEQVLKILDTNPSYVQLCESIEWAGIKFDRAAMAKELLKAVPDGLRANNANKPVTPATAGSGAPVAVPGATGSPADATKKRGPGRPRKDGPLNYGVPHSQRSRRPINYQVPSFTSLSDAAREVNSMSTASNLPPNVSTSLASAISGGAVPPAGQIPYFEQPITSHSPMQAPAPEVKAEEKPEEPPRPPANKEEAARKRTFTDLVDLSKDDSDDEGPPRKVQQTSVNGGSRPPHDLLTKPMSFEEFKRQGLTGIGPNQGSSHLPVPPRKYGSPVGGSYHAQHRPLGPGQPLLAPQNTLPSHVAPRPAGPTEEQKQYERMRGKMLVEPIMRDRVARKSRYDSRTIARDVLLATGRHPDMRALNAHLNTMQKLLGDHGGVVDGAGNKSDLATIRWDIIDPGESGEDAKAKVNKAVSGRDKPAVGADAESDIDDNATGIDDGGDWATGRAEEALRKIRVEGVALETALLEIRDPMVRRQIRHRIHVQRHQQRKRSAKNASKVPPADDTAGEQRDGGAGSTSYVYVQEQLRGSTNSMPVKRGPGRPPKNRVSINANASPNVATSKHATPLPGTPEPAASVNLHTSGDMASGTPVGYAAFRQLDAAGNPIKKKGRPVGWRKAVHSREAQGLTPAKPGSSHKPAASRLRQSTGPARAEDKLVQPQYQVFRCRWQDCTAELDNLDRLKKHTVKLHGGANNEGEFECRWRSCKFAGKHVNASGKVRDGGEGITSFETMEHWMKHVDKEHFGEVAWKLGDGPRGGSVSEAQTDSDAYLSDRFGRSVTPIIRPASEQAQVSTASPERSILTSDLPTRPVGRSPKLPIAQIGRQLKDPKHAGMSKEEREAANELKKLEDQKKAEGVVMGQEGSKLVNAKRRRGFLDDEDFEDFIYDSEPELP